MEPIMAISGKNATLSVFNDRVEYQKFGHSFKVISYYSCIIHVEFRMMTFFDTGFIKVRCPKGNFDFVTHKLSYKEASDCPRAQALGKTFNLIQELRQKYNAGSIADLQTAGVYPTKADEIKKFADLLAQGFINQDEFEQQKKKILG